MFSEISSVHLTFFTRFMSSILVSTNVPKEKLYVLDFLLNTEVNCIKRAKEKDAVARMS